MKFIPGNGENPLHQPDAQAHIVNALFEQICILRADVSALHGVTQFLATKQGVPVEKLQNVRIQLRDTAYQQICKDVLAQIRGDFSSDPPQE